MFEEKNCQLLSWVSSHWSKDELFVNLTWIVICKELLMTQSQCQSVWFIGYDQTFSSYLIGQKHKCIDNNDIDLKMRTYGPWQIGTVQCQCDLQ